MTSDESHLYELDLGPELSARPAVAAALEGLSEALAEEGLLIDAEVAGFASTQRPTVIDRVGKRPPIIAKPTPDSAFCIGEYWDDETGKGGCTIFW